MYISFAVLGSKDSSYSWHCSEQRWNNTGCTSLNYIGVLQVNVHQYMSLINFACIVCLSIVFSIRYALFCYTFRWSILSFEYLFSVGINS